MNHIYRLVWNNSQGAYVAVIETAKGRGKSANKVGSAVAAVVLAISAHGATLPTGGQVTAGTAAISSTTNTLTVDQGSQRAAINWQSFSIGSDATVNFVQPNASSVILNRVAGNERSVIAGAMNANGQVFLLNSNGVLFTGTSSVNVGGLVASTLNVTDADFMAGRNIFAANGSKASVINLGTLNATDGGYVALLGNQVKNEGVITAKLGNAIMAAGDQVSLNFNGDSLVGVSIDQGSLNALVENKQAIHADGGLVVLTAKGLDAVMATVVNNTGEVRAQTIANREGKIYLLGGMDNNRIEVGGTLDASAPNGGNGGFVETSAAKVKFANDVAITTKATSGASGTWLIDPLDFTIAASGGDITGTALGTLLGSNSIQIETATAPTASATNLIGSTGTNGDIFVNDPVSWSANTSLTLNAFRNININQNITASGANGKLVLYYGQGAVAASNTADYNVAQNTQINLQDGLNFSTKLGSDGTTSNGFAVDYTVISSAAALQNINSTLAGNFAIGSNVNLTGVTWTPIGTIAANSRFTGAFDGLGHTISNLTINSTASYTGLFGVVDQAARLQNVGITNGNVQSTSDDTGGLVGNNVGMIKNSYFSGTVTAGGKNVGGLVGTNSFYQTNPMAGTISNSYATGSVTSTSTTGQDANAGGLVGYNSFGTKIDRSYANSTVTGSSVLACVGGLVGRAQDSNTITNSYASGTVTGGIYVGGLVGIVNGSSTITNVYSTATVISTGTASQAPGGLVPAGGLIGYVPSGLTITNAYASGSVSGNDPTQLGGFIGVANGLTITNNNYWDITTTGQATAFSSMQGSRGSSGGTGIANANAYTQASYTGFDFTSTGAWFSVDGYTRPFLRMEATNNISNAHQLQLMSMNLANSYALINNIDLAPSLTNKSEMWKDNSASVNYSAFTGSWIPIGTGGATTTPNSATAFTGNLAGLGHTIDHLTISAPSSLYQGFFGYINGASVSNLGITNFNIAGATYVGGLVGYAGPISGAGSGTLSNVYAAGSAYATGTSFGYIGGLVGRSNVASILNAYSSGTVTGTASNVGGLIGNIFFGDVVNSYSSSAVTGAMYVGGFAGAHRTGVIERSYATGNVTGTNGRFGRYGGFIGDNFGGTINDSYATGNVNGSSYVGGFIGLNRDTWGGQGIINRSYSVGSVTGTSYVGGFVGSNDPTSVQGAGTTPGVINNSFWDMQTSGLSTDGTSSTAVGKTTTEMKFFTTFNGASPSWDVVIDPSLTNVYPQLRWATNGLTAGSSVWVMGASPIYLRLESGGSSIYGSTPTFGYAYYTTVGGSTAVTDASPSSGSAVWSGAPTASSDAGIYSLTYSSGLTLGNSAYTLSPGSAVNWTVNKASLTVTANPANRLYGATNPTLTTTVSGFVNGQDATTAAGFVGAGTATTTAIATTNVGTATITAGAGNLSATNYDFTNLVDGTLTINKAHLTVAADNQTRLYGAANPTLTQTITGFVNNENLASSGVTGSVSGTTGATANTAVGQAAIAASTTGLVAGNYDFAASTTDGVLTINQAPLTVTASNASKVYGQTPALTGFTSSGLVNSETIGGVTETSSGTAVTAGVAGSPYTITPSAATGGTFAPGNYNISYVNGNLTVTPLAVTVAAASSATRVYDGTTTAAANLLNVTNAINGDTVTLAGNATLAGSNAGAQALSGIADLTISNPNYTVAGGAVTGSVMVSVVASVPESVIANIATQVPSNSNATKQPSLTLPGQSVATPATVDRAANTLANVVNPLPHISAAFGTGTSLAVISAPGANEPSQVVSLSQVRNMLLAASGASADATAVSTQNGASVAQAAFAAYEVRVPVSRNSLAEIVNGGVKLPDGVEQELFVVQAN